MRRHHVASLFTLIALAVASDLAQNVASGQDQNPRVFEGGEGAAAPQLLVIYDAVLLKSSSGKPIREVFNESDSVVRINRFAANQRKLLVTVNDRTAPRARLWLTDEDGNRDQFEIVIRSLVELPVGGTHALQARSKKPLRVINYNKKVSKVTVSENDPSVAQVEALAVGMSSLTLFDSDQSEVVDIIVVQPNRSMKVGERIPLQTASGKPLVQLEISGSDRGKVMRKEDLFILNRGENHVVVYSRNMRKSTTMIVEMGRKTRHLLLDDLTELLLEAVEPGLVRLVLTDADNKTEALDILVTPK